MPQALQGLAALPSRVRHGNDDIQGSGMPHTSVDTFGVATLTLPRVLQARGIILRSLWRSTIRSAVCYKT